MVLWRNAVTWQRKPLRVGEEVWVIHGTTGRRHPARVMGVPSVGVGKLRVRYTSMSGHWERVLPESTLLRRFFPEDVAQIVDDIDHEGETVTVVKADREGLTYGIRRADGRVTHVGASHIDRLIQVSEQVPG